MIPIGGTNGYTKFMEVDIHFMDVPLNVTMITPVTFLFGLILIVIMGNFLTLEVN